jgi:hypothetical protein
MALGDVLFADDFSAGAIGPAWAVHRGEWSQANGIISQTSIINDNFYKKIQIEGISFPGDVEIVARVRVDSQNSDNLRFGLCLNGDQNGYGYDLQVTPGVIAFNWDLNHGSAAYKLFSWTIGVWYRLRFRQQSVAGINTLFGNMWADGDPEPADWMVTSTEFDAMTGAPGLWGGHVDGGTVSFDDVQVFDMSAGPAATPVGISSDASWDIYQNIGVNSVDSWDVQTTAGTTAESAWDILESVGLAGESTWDILASVTMSPVGIAGDSTWDILGRVYVNGITSWDVRVPAGRTGSDRWDNRVPVSLARSAVWANMVPVGIGSGASWDLRTPAGIAVNALWHVRGRVGGGFIDRWDNRSGAGLERSADWSLRGLAGLAGSVRWDISTLLAHWPVGIGGRLTWADRKRLGFSGMVTWNDRLPRGLTRNALHNIHIKIGKISTVKFHTRSRLGTTWSASWSDRLLRRVTYQDRWNGRALAGLTAAGHWTTRGLVGLARPASWSMRIPVSMSLSGTWRDRARVATAGACVWDLRARVGSNQHTYWNISNPVRLTAEASWDLRDVVGVNGDVIFMTFLATRPGGMDFDPAAAAAYVEAQHGLNPWGSIPAPWSVRIDHDYPTPDAMRATRGSGKDGIPGVIIRIFNRNDYLSGLRQDPRDVLGRTLTGPDGRWINSVYLIPGEYIILYEEAARFPVADLLTVIGTVPGREPPDLPPGDFNSPYYELDYYLSITHGWGTWGPGNGRGPSPVDHHFGGIDHYTFTRNGKGLEDVIVEIYPEADFLAGRTGDRYRAGWSRTNAAGRWDWPVNLYPGRYSAIGWRDGVATQFVIEVP